MEVVEFIKETGRMCTSYGDVCYGCPVYDFGEGQPCEKIMRNHPEEFVKAVEKWANEHPIVTNRQKLEEVLGIKILGEPMIEFNSSWLDREYKAPKK